MSDLNVCWHVWTMWVCDITSVFAVIIITISHITHTHATCQCDDHNIISDMNIWIAWLFQCGCVNVIKCSHSFHFTLMFHKFLTNDQMTMQISDKKQHQLTTNTSHTLISVDWTPQWTIKWKIIEKSENIEIQWISHQNIWFIQYEHVQAIYYKQFNHWDTVRHKNKWILNQ